MNIYVMECGWIIVGEKTSDEPDSVLLEKSSVVRRWDNGLGIGGLAKEEHKAAYTLDAIGAVCLRKSKILFEIPCEWGCADE